MSVVLRGIGMVMLQELRKVQPQVAKVGSPARFRRRACTESGDGRLRPSATMAEEAGILRETLNNARPSCSTPPPANGHVMAETFGPGD